MQKMQNGGIMPDKSKDFNEQMDKLTSDSIAPKVKKARVKDLIPMETRISLFQTSMNNAGRNYEGKRTTVKKMAEFATEFYRLAIKEIEMIGALSVQQIQKSFLKASPEKITKKNDVKKLMKKIQKRRSKK
jgi:hypothetical protein